MSSPDVLPVLNELHSLAKDRGAGLQYDPDSQVVTIHETLPDGRLAVRRVGHSFVEAVARLRKERREMLTKAGLALHG